MRAGGSHRFSRRDMRSHRTKPRWLPTFLAESNQCEPVGRHGVIREVPAHHAGQPRPLLRDEPKKSNVSALRGRDIRRVRGRTPRFPHLPVRRSTISTEGPDGTPAARGGSDDGWGSTENGLESPSYSTVPLNMATASDGLPAFFRSSRSIFSCKINPLLAQCPRFFLWHVGCFGLPLLVGISSSLFHTSHAPKSLVKPRFRRVLP